MRAHSGAWRPMERTMMAKSMTAWMAAGAVVMAFGVGACGDDDTAGDATTPSASSPAGASTSAAPDISNVDPSSSSTPVTDPTDSLNEAMGNLESLMTSLLGVSKEQVDCLESNSDVLGDGPTANTGWNDETEAVFDECGMFEWAEEMFGLSRDGIVCLGENGSTLDDLTPDLNSMAGGAPGGDPQLPPKVTKVFEDCGVDPAVITDPDPSPWLSNLLEGLFGLEEDDADCIAGEMPDDAIENVFGAGHGPAVSIDPSESTPEGSAPVGQEAFAEDLFAAMDACGVSRDELQPPNQD